MKSIFAKKGFTMAEVLIAIAIIVFVWAASVQVFLGNVSLTQTNEDMTKAFNDLTDVMEMIRDSSLAYLMERFPDGIEARDLTMENTLDEETITIYYQQAVSPGPTEISVEITWNQNGRDFKVEARTLKF